MERVASRNDSFNRTFHDADTTGDSVPDSDLESVYDAFYAADEDAAAEFVLTRNSSDTGRSLRHCKRRSPVPAGCYSGVQRPRRVGSVS